MAALNFPASPALLSRDGPGVVLVALADAPAGPQWRINKGGTDYAVYLVDTTDPNASQVRIETGAGIKAARLKT